MFALLYADIADDWIKVSLSDKLIITFKFLLRRILGFEWNMLAINDFRIIDKWDRFLNKMLVYKHN